MAESIDKSPRLHQRVAHSALVHRDDMEGILALVALMVPDLVQHQAVLVARSPAVVVGNRILLEALLAESMDQREVAGRVGLVEGEVKRFGHRDSAVLREALAGKLGLGLVEAENNRS